MDAPRDERAGRVRRDDAWQVRLRGAAIPTDGATPVDAQPVGHYALQLRFGDGHERGIYPWALLRTLAGERAVSARSGTPR